MKTLLALTGVAGLVSSVHAAASCADCGGNTCMLDGTATTITGGATSLSVNFCNFDSSKNSTYALNFGVSSLPSCDAKNATLPTLASLVAADGCTPDTCAVTVSFESALDWAIALQNNGATNTLTAQLTAGDNSDTVTIARFETMAAAVMNSGTASVSVCATEVDVSGSRFSSISSCNAAQICRGASTDTTCTTELMKDAQVADVSCNGEACTGKVALSQSLPCDGSTGDATALIVGVTVASSTQSNLVSVGSMAAPNFTISDASGLDAGSSELVLTTDTFCAYSSIQLNVTLGDGSDDDSSETVEVSSVNSTTNGTVVVELASPLSSDLAGEDIELSLSQCGVSATGEFSVGKGSDESTSVSTGSSDSSQDDAVAGSTGSVSTQEENADSGLSGSIIVGIIIAAVALAGFVFEYVHHKRRQPVPLAQDSTVNNLTTPM
ncbi:hypothetical protein JG687_00005152 [Phytophthora cactorum]|uniref:Uncharacterized protein n=1 Tax=Phytophthora cactorum TaxID=29920 RepID=A0A329S1K6_9STRA|nr:hypothetical protein Pcac1_g14172 [Phytophthora cactorum]KAG2833046.1 hypothetical protein PC112_g6639 [Phytophthora cactorum]KAG2835200.1 hypothetical protein PC111_g5514 [Phytophthora cactorum]KAG2860146.1 hypothetical protein PC113_g8317 [Phytophthora cactorum]KAG2913605.1 hypothetical protein PC114_g8508 [Phytophthora cactorum]